MIALVKWRKKEMDNLRREMDDLFDRCFGSFPELSEQGEWSPCLDLAERDEEIIIRVELPGMEARDLELSVAGRMLTLRGTKRREECSLEERYRCKERSYGQFTRTIELPAVVDPERVEAVFKNGVLELTLPKRKKEHHGRTTIAVK